MDRHGHRNSSHCFATVSSTDHQLTKQQTGTTAPCWRAELSLHCTNLVNSVHTVLSPLLTLKLSLSNCYFHRTV